MFQNNDVEHGHLLVPPVPLKQKAVIGNNTGLDQMVDGIWTVDRDEQILNGQDEQICGEPVDGLNVFDAENMGMEGLFITACERVLGGTR
jgi:hypothetical protein